MRATIVIPNGADRYGDAVETCKRELADRYNGYTEYAARGGWVNYEDELIEESVTVIETHGDVVDKGGMTMLAERVREMTDETAVMATVGGQKIIV